MKTLLRSAASFGAAIFLSTSALAQTSASAVQVSAPSATEGLLHSLLGLIVVVGLIFSAGWVMKRFRPVMQPRSGLYVLGSTSVGTRERVVLVRYQDEVLILGVAPGQVSLLKAAPAPLEEPNAAPATPVFVERFKAAMRSRRG
jgi:flagellar protein FliO/FliZ